MNLFITVSDNPIEIHPAFAVNDMIVCFSRVEWSLKMKNVTVKVISSEINENALLNEIIPETILSLIYEMESVIVAHWAVFIDESKYQNFQTLLNLKSHFKEEYAQGYTKSYMIDKLFKNQINFLLPTSVLHEQYQGKAMLGEPVPEEVVITMLQEIVYINGVHEFSKSQDKDADSLSRAIATRYSSSTENKNTFITSNVNQSINMRIHYTNVILVTKETVDLSGAAKKFKTSSGLNVVVFQKNN